RTNRGVSRRVQLLQRAAREHAIDVATLGASPRMRAAIPHLLALCALIATCAPQAKADAVADFYKGRTVTVVVSSSAAGGYETLARALARPMGPHKAGPPVLILPHMSGGGGSTAAHFLLNQPHNDGNAD